MGRRRGFTLIEVMVVVAVVSIVGSLAVMGFVRWQRHGAVREAGVAMVGDLRELRALAQSGRTDFAGFGPGVRVEQAGLRRVGASTYEVFVDRDELSDGNELTLRTIELPVHGFPIEVVWPVPELRFDRSGLLATGTEQRFTVRDTQANRSVTVLVSLGGKSELLR